MTGKPITHIIYSHSHVDHIAGAKSLGGHPVIIAHEETLRLLKRAADPNRPLPTLSVWVIAYLSLDYASAYAARLLAPLASDRARL